MIDAFPCRLLFLPILGLALTPAFSQSPTWSDDIACIVQSHCTPCHRDDGPGHFELVTYTDAYYWRNEMQAATSSRFMPPWPPDPAYRSLAHERILTQSEIDLIAAWVDAGAPEGDPLNAPPPPVFNGSAVITEPDLTTVMDDFVIPASSVDLYRCFVLDIDNPTDRFITAMEVIPGNRAMVHHVLVFQDTTGEARLLDEADIGPGYTSFGGIGVPSAKLVGGWVPGEEPFFTPQGMGIQLFADADIVIQVHYPATSEVELDSTRINLLLSDAPFLRPMYIDPVLEHTWTLTNGPLVIPANEVRSFHSEFEVPFNSTILTISPHAHLICTSMRAYAVVPGGDTIPLIDIPNWDFRWQGHYSFRQPIFLPTGTMLHGEATYDNTENNPFNPNSPPELVHLGESTTDEMMLFYFAWTPGLQQDENIVIDNSWHMDHHLDCVPDMLVGITEKPATADLHLWPSPASDVIMLDAGRARGIATIFESTGRLVRAIRISNEPQVIKVGDLARGTYVLEFKGEDGSVGHRRVVLE